MTIDRITKYGEIDADSPKLDDEEILRQPILFNRDTGKYMPLNDANPIIQTILNRVHGNNNLLTNTRLTSSDLAKSDSNLSLSKQLDEEYSSSSDSSSVKSGQTLASSTLSDHPKKSSTSNELKSSSSKFSTMNFFRRKKKTIPEQDKPMHIDEDEKILINDGLHGELKYKASKHLHETPQFEKTQLIQTIVNAHLGPIWCMR